MLRLLINTALSVITNFAIIVRKEVEGGERQMDDKQAAMARLQARIDAINKRMVIDSNDLDYETHLRQKRQLQQILDRMKGKINNK